MDLSSMLNEGPAPDKKPTRAPLSQAEPPRVAPVTTPSRPNANWGPPALYSHAHGTPPVGTPNGVAALSRQSSSLTPLQTPAQSGASAYRIQQPLQSPAAAGAVAAAPGAAVHPPGPNHLPYGAYSATTSGGRPPGQGFPYPHASPSQHQRQPSIPSSVQYAHQGSSLSPTPPSRHNHTPNPQSYSHPHLQQYQQSQPTTPLGPHLLQYQRSSNHSHSDLQSPQHHRNYSGASNSLASASPAQHHPSIGNLVDSPSAHSRQSPHLRRTSEYLAQQDRERSVSVSPKTRVPPRIPSQVGSRHGSQQDAQRQSTTESNSLQHHSSSTDAPRPGAPSHVTQLSPKVAQTSPAPHSHSHSQLDEVARTTFLNGQMPYSGMAAHPEGSPLSTHLNKQSPPEAIKHEPGRMDMHHLLAPAKSVADMDREGDGAKQTGPQQSQQRTPQGVDLSTRLSPEPEKVTIVPPLSSAPPSAGGPESAEVDAIAQADATSHKVQSVPAVEAKVHVPTMSKIAHLSEPKKRPAEGELGAEEPPAKKGRKRKYTERPIWARLAPSHPKYDPTTNGMNGASALSRPQQPYRSHLPPRSNGVSAQNPRQQTAPQANGHALQRERVTGSMDLDRPWLQEPPLDNDLIRARQMFGHWEKSIRWSQPVVDMEKVVADWLYIQLMQLQDVEDDPQIGSIEIEAKIGQIIDKRSDMRMQLPVQSATVVSETWCRENTRFESQMEKHEHKAMNDFLNVAIQATMNNKGRVGMQYKHPKETDSFRALSAAGFAALPPSFKKIPSRQGRDLRLRTTTNEKGQVTARIVKSHVADMHIFNPQYDYDCRITINLEANMNRPELAPFEDLVAPISDLGASYKREQPPDRKKDRLSYTHLAYSIDLTRVDVPGLTKYELELEVDASVLRQQIAAINEGRSSGYQAVVSGFLDNATYLMRQRPGPPA